MIFDELFVSLAVASLILGFLTVVIVGSQTPADARSIGLWAFLVLAPMLLISCARIAVSGDPEGISGGSGMIVFFSTLIAAIGLGYRFASLHRRDSEIVSKGKKGEAPLWDDELA